MGPRNEVDPAVKDAIVAELLDPQDPRRSRAAIAKAHGVSVRTVSRYADEAGVENPFSTRDVRVATEAARDRLAVERAKVSELYLRRARELLEQMDGEFLVFSFGGKENDYNEHTLDRAPTADLRNLVQASGIAFDKHIAADKHDTDAGDDAARQVLGDLFTGLGKAYSVIRGTDPPTDPADAADPDEEAPR